jgi:hypothetical protein
MSYNISIAIIYISSIALIVTGLAFGTVVIGQLIFGVMLLALGLASKTKFSPFKLLENRISALIWVVLAILISFSAYLFGNTSQQVILWSSISIGLTNLLAVLISKINIEEASK